MGQKREKKAAVIHCCAESKIKDGIDPAQLPADCSEIRKLYPEGIRACSWGCLGGGSCMAACRLEALSLAGGRPVVDRDVCVGCGLCMKACPMGLISLEPSYLTIQVICRSRDTGALAKELCPASCIGCGICEKKCPSGAIHVENGYAVMDPDKCIACGICAKACPMGILEVVELEK